VKNSMGRLRDLGYITWIGCRSETNNAKLSNRYEIVGFDPMDTLEVSMPMDNPEVSMGEEEPAPSMDTLEVSMDGQLSGVDGMVTHGEPRDGHPIDVHQEQTRQQILETDHGTVALTSFRADREKDLRTVEEKRALKDDPRLLALIAEEEAREATANAS
jgi:hypothetical protein